MKGSKRRILFFSVSAILIALIAFGFWYWTTNKDAIIEKKIQKAIAKTQDEFYRVSYDDIYLQR